MDISSAPHVDVAFASNGIFRGRFITHGLIISASHIISTIVGRATLIPPAIVMMLCVPYRMLSTIPIHPAASRAVAVGARCAAGV